MKNVFLKKTNFLFLLILLNLIGILSLYFGDNLKQAFSENLGFDNYLHISIGASTAGHYTFSEEDLKNMAGRYDYLIGNFPMPEIRAINPNIQNYPYIDLTMFNNGNPYNGRDGHTDEKIIDFVNSYNALNDPDIDAEDFYAHAKADCDMLYLKGVPGHCPSYNVNDPTCLDRTGCPYSFITGTQTQVFGWNPDSPGLPAPGCWKSSALTRKASRQIAEYLPQWDVPNYKLPQLADYFVHIAKTENISWGGGPSAINGLFFDTVILENQNALANGLHMTHEYWGIDVRSNTTPTQAFYDYLSLQNNVQAQLNAVAAQENFRWPGNVVFIPNEFPLSIYTPETLNKVQDLFVEIFFEGFKDAKNTYQTECGQFKSLIDETINQGKKVFLNSYEVNNGNSNCPSNDCRSDRGKIESLAMYYLLQNNLTTYLYEADVTPFTIEAFWNSAVAVNMGEPALMPEGAQDIFGEQNTKNFYNFLDPSGGFECPVVNYDKYKNLGSIVYARSYTNGLVLVKHRAISSNDTYSDLTSQNYPLEGYYFPVLADGSVSSNPINNITLRNSEAAILLRAHFPILDFIGDKRVIKGQTLNFDITATDVDSRDSLIILMENAPSSATLSATTWDANLQKWRATFTWNNADQNYSDVYFEVSDGALSDSEIIDIKISFPLENINPPNLSPIGNKSVNEGDLLEFMVSATDIDRDPLAFSVTGLPEGAAFENNTFSWLPNYEQSGNYLLVFYVTDGVFTDSEIITITVNNTNRPPELDFISGKTVNEGELLTFKVSATDPDNDPLTYKAENLPRGAAFDADKAEFNWVPDYSQSGTYLNIYFEANDPYGGCSLTSIKIVVNNVNQAPRLEPLEDLEIKEGDFLTIQLSASDPDNDVLSFSASTLPKGAILDSNSGLFSWRPLFRQAGNYQITFTVKDSFGATDSALLNIRVLNKALKGVPLTTSNIKASKVTATSAMITWVTNKKATSEVQYDTTLDYENTSFPNQQLKVKHSVVVKDLKPNTYYHYRVISSDNVEKAVSADYTFKTAAYKVSKR